MFHQLYTNLFWYLVFDSLVMYQTILIFDFWFTSYIPNYSHIWFLFHQLHFKLFWYVVLIHLQHMKLNGNYKTDKKRWNCMNQLGQSQGSKSSLCIIFLVVIFSIHLAIYGTGQNIPRPGFGKNLPEKKSSPPFLSHENDSMYLLYASYANEHTRVTWPSMDYFLIFKNGFFWKKKS